MRLALTLGVAFAALTTMAASAQQNQHDRVVVRHVGGHAEMDANDDGWISREESAAAADRIFGELDSNDDGRLDDEDHARFEHDIQVHVGPGASAVDDENCTRTSEGEEGNQRVTVICRSESGGSSTDERTVIIRRGGGEWTTHDGATAPIPPVPPVPPVPPAPMFMMMLGDESESDLNGDGALSREEFRAQHQRFFDARDANGDGRVRAHVPPQPPAPPAPPAPPEPPRRR